NIFWASGASPTFNFADATHNLDLLMDPALLNPGDAGTLNDPDQLATLRSAYSLKQGSPAIDEAWDLQSRFGVDPGKHDFSGISIPQNDAYDLGANEF